jgi:hypothetical protein
VVQHRHKKVLGFKEKHQIPAQQAAECGVLITVITLYESYCWLWPFISDLSQKEFGIETYELYTS